MKPFSFCSSKFRRGMEEVKQRKPKTRQRSRNNVSEIGEEALDPLAIPAPLTLNDVEEAQSTTESSNNATKGEGDALPEVVPLRLNQNKPTRFDRTLSATSSATDKENEDRLSTGFVRELPLDALLPRRSSENNVEERTQTTEQTTAAPISTNIVSAPVIAEPHFKSVAGQTNGTSTANSSIYPRILTAVEAKASKIERAPQLPKICVEQAMEANATGLVYPLLSEMISAPAKELFDESELLTEGQLLEYYRNEHLDFVDDFVDVFVNLELEPRNCLFDLLSKYKAVCEKLEANEAAKSSCVQTLTALNNEVWHVEDCKVIRQGKCNCGRNASGESTYKVAHFKAEKLVAVSEELNRMNELELDVGFCQEVRANTLALHIQWVIVDLVDRFFAEHQLSHNSVPILLGTTHSLLSRIALKKALSDLFYFIRFPVLPERFRSSITTWISEIGAVLLRACTPDDQMFLMCQILRTPSPLSPWSISLVQTFITSPNLDISAPMNVFVALLSIVLQPVKCREQFLCRLTTYYEGENSWNFVSDDGDTENGSMIDISEMDFIEILRQFAVRPLFAAALKYFTFIHQNNRLQVMLSLVSFVLVFLKICNDGIATYSRLKNVCKKICEYIRTIVQNFCNFWNLVKSEFVENDRKFIQNEVNRVVLQAVCYIVSKNNIRLWQFLVDFPFESVTENCRLRCQLLLRNTQSMSVRSLYEIPDVDLIDRIKKCGNLSDQLKAVNNNPSSESTNQQDMTYKILALSSVISHCEVEQNFLVFEIVHLCFLDEVTREDYYKVGSEAVSVLLERKPSLLQFLMKYIDRNVDHLDNYAIDILANSSSSLAKCVLSSEDVGNVLGKWLINRSVDHPASQIARLILCSMNWGGFDGDLRMPAAVHDACADTIVKAHIVHCKNHNGMIAKSMSKAAKMAMKCPDLEQQFDKFCWDVLVKLKISPKSQAQLQATDLTAFFLFIEQKCLLSHDAFMEFGMKYFVELVNASCLKACVLILTQLVAKFSAQMAIFTVNAGFRDCLERVIHADESPYALQLLVGSDAFPGPILTLIASAINFQLYTADVLSTKKRLALAWLDMLTTKKSVEWNADKFVLYLIGVVTRCAFCFDPNAFFGMEPVLENLYKNQYVAWKESMKGPLSWFSSHLHPPLIPSHLMDVAPWATFFMLKVEPNFFGAFYDFFNDSLCKHPQRSVEEAMKKANSKSHIYFTVERLHYSRWLEFCLLPGVIEHDIYPLALQCLCHVMFARKIFERKQYCPGLQYLKCATSDSLFKQLKNNVLPKAEKALADNTKLAAFYRTIAQWLFAEELYAPDFAKFSEYNLDHLLEMIVAGDSLPWTDFVNGYAVRKKVEDGMKMFLTCYHLNGSSGLPAAPSSPSLLKIESLTTFFKMLDSPVTDSREPPPILQHKQLPIHERLDAGWHCQSTLVSRMTALLDDVGKLARTYINGKESLEALNTSYLEYFQKLYADTKQTVRVSLRCGNMLTTKCPKPSTVDVTVTLSIYDQVVANNMNENRVKRGEQLAPLLMMLNKAISYAHMEYISCQQSELMNCQRYSKEAEQLKATGTALFYKICSFVDISHILFPALVDCFEACLERLGGAFISNNPAEQLNLMRVVKSGNPLNHFLVRHFTPHCIPSALLFQLYNELSNSVRDASTSDVSLALLSRLDIEHAGNMMPVNQFLSLMPIMFENIAYVSDGTPLRQLCVKHFIHAMFHHFPCNFAAGWKLILSGCDTQVVPEELFARIIARFDVFDVVLNEHYAVKIAQQLQMSSMSLSSEQALECVRLCAEQLSTSRHLLNARLFTVWAQNLEMVCKISDYFIRLIVYQTFNNNAQTMTIEKELRDIFYLLVSVWGPLFEPMASGGGAPWNTSDNALAATLLDRFVTHLNWLPHNVYLPPGSETSECLFWRYFSSRLLGLQRGGTIHVFGVYESRIVRLNWARFWPTLLDLGTVEQSLVDGPPELAPLIVEIIVRFPWPHLFQHQHGVVQPEDAHRAFYSLMLSILARCIYRSSNYAKSRASMESLLKIFLDQGRWHYVKLETAKRVGEFIVASFPSDSLTNTTNDVLMTFFCVWRETCCFSTVQRGYAVEAANDEGQRMTVSRMRAIYVRTSMGLMLKSTSMDKEARRKFYKEMLTKVNQFMTADDKTQYLGIVKELVAFWTEFSKEKHISCAMKALTEWLIERCESPMVLLLLNCVMDTSLATNHALALLDSCIQIYFKRKLSYNWMEVCQWLSIPERSREWLYTTPRSDSEVPQTYYFVLNAHLMSEMSQLNSASDECKLLRRIADYIQSIKPKYVTANEGAFLLCVEKWQRMLVRQFTNGVSAAVANEDLEQYVKWLRRVYTDDRGGGSFFSAVVKFAARRPQAFSTRLQLFANIMEYYITQQLLSSTQPPRLDVGQPVLNSRIHAFRELAQQKAYAEFAGGAAFTNATPFFTAFDTHTLRHAMQLFGVLAQALYIGEKYLKDIS